MANDNADKENTGPVYIKAVPFPNPSLKPSAQTKSSSKTSKDSARPLRTSGTSNLLNLFNTSVQPLPLQAISSTTSQVSDRSTLSTASKKTKVTDTAVPIRDSATPKVSDTRIQQPPVQITGSTFRSTTRPASSTASKSFKRPLPVQSKDFAQPVSPAASKRAKLSDTYIQSKLVPVAGSTFKVPDTPIQTAALPPARIRPNHSVRALPASQSAIDRLGNHTQLPDDDVNSESEDSDDEDNVGSTLKEIEPFQPQGELWCLSYLDQLDICLSFVGVKFEKEENRGELIEKYAQHFASIPEFSDKVDHLTSIYCQDILSTTPLAYIRALIEGTLPSRIKSEPELANHARTILREEPTQVVCIYAFFFVDKQSKGPCKNQLLQLADLLELYCNQNSDDERIKKIDKIKGGYVNRRYIVNSQGKSPPKIAGPTINSRLASLVRQVSYTGLRNVVNSDTPP
ncbi:hypothetical protein BT63DRAFT_478427 [Microthyrium microscopicum]|uniref:Uncharacterized protein n=1 Tax=Microthyrium microscopicum TaxID=703497 RepID=A0A6A6UFB9_9PEZI|nr:hypothetical protein BT63DRAFT_478427 [Microthyrium microscopicum]